MSISQRRSIIVFLFLYCFLAPLCAGIAYVIFTLLSSLGLVGNFFHKDAFGFFIETIFLSYKIGFLPIFCSALVNFFYSFYNFSRLTFSIIHFVCVSAGIIAFYIFILDPQYGFLIAISSWIPLVFSGIIFMIPYPKYLSPFDREWLAVG
ncbi:hypothetical protein [Notoacmeibacter sp. MSK16QG-6]|uniref:hypothetical protein n=1 Tax=Notoacmeibacter sp. MSK16QG-6 TaxID=2957982 RepID=UPI0020A04DEF|nr:hypothetical protein [Notoacmeibacter sp. MSK16QG-6]MCP1200123.1 hypothetical protein [Notoacmeibacter sp. MSK16QG-6]